MKFFLFTLLVLFLTGCTGAMYQTPSVTDEEVGELTKTLDKKNNNLVVYQRSDRFYESTLKRVSSKLKKSAKPLCNDSGYISCYFQTIYSPSPVVNAYASEGYKITIHRGLLQYLKTEDEMAAVVAHEMGHHLAKHNEKQGQNAATGAAVSGLLTAILIGAANANNPYYDHYQQQQDEKTIENMMKAGAHLGVLSYSKEQEKEADLLAAYLLSRAGYNLSRAGNIMHVLANLNGEAKENSAAFLSSHPAGLERVVSWQKAMQEIKANKDKLPKKLENSK